jgi:phosphopantetheinyl transferase (holo-ACP synthase)
VRTLLWAAKEAAYKAAGLDEELRPRTVAIESLGLHAFSWTARSGFVRAAGVGRFLAAGRHVVAVAVTTSRAAAAPPIKAAASGDAITIHPLETVLA